MTLPARPATIAVCDATGFRRRTMYTTRIQVINYGPIDELDIDCPFDGDRPKPLVLVGENGSGKSLVLSHVVNGLLLAQQLAYPESPEVEAGKVYKLRSPFYIRSGCNYYFARVEFENNVHISELQLERPRRTYDAVPPGMKGPAAHALWNQMNLDDNSLFLPSFNEQRLRELLQQNCALYLPPNRFEDPAWLNEDNLTAKARHMGLRHRKGHTERTVTNYSPLRDNENWLFDIVYDFSVFERQTHNLQLPVQSRDKSTVTVPLPIFGGFSGRAKTIYDIALRVVQTIIKGENVRFGIGTRHRRVVSVMQNERQLVPNIFQLSSGEVSLLNLFLSILRDFDLCETSFATPEDIRGVVVVDEVDLHLHAVHQHEVLPKLIQMFPRIQFIVTTHSPLFVLGLRSALGETGFGLYLLPHARQIAPEDFNEFGEAYRVFRTTSTHSAEIEEAVRKTERPLVFVDGVTDVSYLVRAMDLLGWQETGHDLEIRGAGGDGNLKNAWKTLTTVAVVSQTVVLLHDCDSNVSPCDRGNVFRRRIQFVEGHPVCTGIENLFSRSTLEKAVVSNPAFVDVVAQHEVRERGHRKTIPEQWKINDDEKRNLCDWICEHGTAEDFRLFGGILDNLREIPGMVRAVEDDGHGVTVSPDEEANSNGSAP